MASQPTAPKYDSTFDSLASLFTSSHDTSSSKSHKIPPLEQWSPPFCGDMDLTIKANGEWWHEGRKMTRQSMIDLFSRVLWAEKTADKTNYFLKTPVEKIGIKVEDVPFLITQVEQHEQDGKTYLIFRTPHGDSVIADEQHPIIFQTPNNPTSNNTPQPYILVRQNGESKLYGLIHRNVFYHLISMGELIESEDGQYTQLILTSGNAVFNLSMPNE